MQSKQVLDLFRDLGALLEGHFELSSGLHSSGYLQCALVLQHPAHAEVLGSALAEQSQHLKPTVVLAPALGGVVIGQEVARGLGVRGIFAERKEGQLMLRRGFTLDSTDRVLIVEDVVTTGKSTRETIAVARETGARVVGATSVVDRSGSLDLFDVPFYSLAAVSWPAYAPESCPQCIAGVRAVKPGSRPRRSAE